MSELKQQLKMRLPDDPFTYEELNAVVGLLAGLGHVWQVEFGQFTLLHLEWSKSNAAAVGPRVRSHLEQIGVIHELTVLVNASVEVQRLGPTTLTNYIRHAGR